MYVYVCVCVHECREKKENVRDTNWTFKFLERSLLVTIRRRVRDRDRDRDRDRGRVQEL